MAENHYINADPEAVWSDMMAAYRMAGGQVLYPGDEKEMLLRAAQSVIVQTLVGMDTALRQATLRYAEGTFLDMYGEKRGCERIRAAKAMSRVSIELIETGEERVIPAGTALTVDGRILYALMNDVTVTGLDQIIQADIECTEAGEAGNGLAVDAIMQFVEPADGVIEITNLMQAYGGRDDEDDEAYRERIRTYGLANVTTGPREVYESRAKEVSTLITDARAVNGGAGVVEIYLLLNTTEGKQAIIDAVEAALSADTVRPLTDTVTVSECGTKSYIININYEAETGSDVSAAISAAVNEYKSWQEDHIGQAFNPDKLVGAIYVAGATRVSIASGSSFNGGACVYTVIGEDEHCAGDINITQV